MCRKLRVTPSKSSPAPTAAAKWAKSPASTPRKNSAPTTSSPPTKTTTSASSTNPEVGVDALTLYPIEQLHSPSFRVADNTPGMRRHGTSTCSDRPRVNGARVVPCRLGMFAGGTTLGPSGFTSVIVPISAAPRVAWSEHYMPRGDSQTEHNFVQRPWLYRGPHPLHQEFPRPAEVPSRYSREHLNSS